MTGIEDDTNGDLTPGQRLARAIRRARVARGWTQDDLIAESGVSEPTIKRWESGRAERVDPDLVRKVFAALDLDPREAPVILGYVTREEMDLPPQQPRTFSGDVESVIQILEDPDIPAAEKREWVEFLKFRTGRTEEERPARRRAAG